MNNKYYNFVSFKSFTGIWSLLVALEIPKYYINFFTTSTTAFFSLNFLFISFLTQARSFLILQVIFPKETFRKSSIWNLYSCEMSINPHICSIPSSKKTDIIKTDENVQDYLPHHFFDLKKLFQHFRAISPEGFEPRKTSEYSANFFSIIYLLKLLQPLYRVPWISYSIVCFSFLLHFCCCDIALKIELSCKFPPEFCNLRWIRWTIHSTPIPREQGC